jgi:hypothetical protein
MRSAKWLVPWKVPHGGQIHSTIDQQIADGTVLSRWIVAGAAGIPDRKAPGSTG